MKRPRRQFVRLGLVLLALVAAGLLAFGPLFVTPANLPAEMPAHAPQRCLAVFVICMALWVTNLIPVAATGLLALALLALLNVLPAAEAFSKFGNSAFFFMLGVFLLAAATITTGLSKRLTLLALHRFDQSPARLTTGVTVSAAFLALWMPEHAVAAMIYPILIEIVQTLHLPTGHRYAKKLFLGLAWGSIIGGVGTFLGGARTPLALNLLKQTYPELSIGFLPWLVAALPVVLGMTIVAVINLRSRMADDLEDIKSATAMLRERVEALGPMSGAERRLAVLGVLTIVAWITLGHTVGLAVISISSATLLFVLGIADWKQLQNYVNWGVLIMYGGAVAIGEAVTETHAMSWVAGQLLHPGIHPVVILIGMAVIAILLTEGISNVAAVAILLPIGYSLGEVVGVDPIMMTLTVTIAAGLAFLLPVSSPPNAISFSAGHYGVREVIGLGWVLNLTAILLLVAVMLLWWPLLRIGSW